MTSSCLPHTENIVWRHPSHLQARTNNPRTHSPDQIAQIARSIERFGFTNPILIHDDDTVVAGHGRLAAAHELGLSKVPTLCLRHLNKAEARAYVIADNQLALNAGWDEAILKDELAFLEDISFETDVLGFEAPEVEALLHGIQEEDEPELPAISETAITGVGDVWHLGPHRLVCGSSLVAEVIQTALGGVQASLMLTDGGARRGR